MPVSYTHLDIKIWGEEGESPSGPQIPSIIKNLPSEETALLGDLVTLSVEASVSDGGALSYQWLKDGEPCLLYTSRCV